MHDGKRGNVKVANAVYLHVTVPVGSELDIVFTSFNANANANVDGAAGVASAARALSGAGFTGKLERRLRAFNGRFDSLFGLDGKACQVCTKRALCAKKSFVRTKRALSESSCILKETYP